MDATDTSGEDGSSTAGGPGASSSGTDAAAETTQTGADETAGASTGDPPTLCEAACVTFDACDDLSPTCVADCDATLRFRNDHFGQECVASVEASYACFAGLTCAEYDAFGCDDVGIEQFVTCEGDVDAGPSVAAFCEAQVRCGLRPAACELAILDDFMSAAYVEGCEADYALLLECVAAAGCMATRQEVDAACAAEADALDGCDIFGG